MRARVDGRLVDQVLNHVWMPVCGGEVEGVAVEERLTLIQHLGRGSLGRVRESRFDGFEVAQRGRDVERRRV